MVRAMQPVQRYLSLIGEKQKKFIMPGIFNAHIEQERAFFRQKKEMAVFIHNVFFRL